jgi:hypothetical protein
MSRAKKIYHIDPFRDYHGMPWRRIRFQRIYPAADGRACIKRYADPDHLRRYDHFLCCHLCRCRHHPEKNRSALFAMISAGLFCAGYLMASFSKGNFLPHPHAGLGILSGASIGFGYVSSLTTSLKWFPKKKGLITGISVAGFRSRGRPSYAACQLHAFALSRSL